MFDAVFSGYFMFAYLWCPSPFMVLHVTARPWRYLWAQEYFFHVVVEFADIRGIYLGSEGRTCLCFAVES